MRVDIKCELEKELDNHRKQLWQYQNYKRCSIPSFEEGVYLRLLGIIEKGEELMIIYDSCGLLEESMRLQEQIVYFGFNCSVQGLREQLKIQGRYSMLVWYLEKIKNQC